jgi:hypothetical protein
LNVLRPALRAGRLSHQLGYLARQHFWTVALLGTLPLLLTYVLESQVPHPDKPGAILPFVAVRVIGEAVVQAATGLLLVELCYRLRAADLQRADTASPASEPPPA